tara:strand:- start:1033 stop:2604 length:1572 start_codon:yes stop_codon:yes gene_type:complete
MNLKDIRNAIFSQADWAPTQSTDAIDRVNAFINRAYGQMAEEAPFLFFEDTLHFATLPDVVDDGSLVDLTGAPTADSLNVSTNDPYVLERTTNGTSNGIDWRVDDYWNGRMLEIEKADGTKVRRLIRDIWNAGGKDQISLYQPWPNTTDSGLVYRIFNQAYYLPDDVIEVNTVRLYSQNEAWPLEVCSQYEAEMLSFKDIPKNVVAGIPRVIYRDAHFQLETPTIAPDLSLPGTLESPVNPWLGPDPAGQFKYVYTYAWGYRDGDSTRGGHVQNYGPRGTLLSNQTAPAARPIPRWESGPSPAASVTATNGGAGVLIKTPNLDFMQGFGRAADARYQHGGWRKRIYRQRVTIDGTVPGGWNAASGQFNQETPDTYYLLADIPAYQVDHTDRGLVVPDYHCRLREVHGYQALRMYPRPDKRYEVEVRCTRRPPELRDDSDVPLIHKDAINSLVQKAIALVYEAQGNMDLADRSLNRYDRDLFTLTKRYGDLRYPGVPLLRRPARAPSLTGSRKAWRRWYNLPNS